MDKPTTVTHIWKNGQTQLGLVSYTVVFSDGRYASMNAEPLHISRGVFWSGKGYPLKEPNEVEIGWEDLPRDCQEAVMIHLQEEQAAA